ncbi:beta-N-acetylglucosaminidase domain-containing protein [[Ruminococcus] torques]|uniref:beta-N-acetylglucosaminidase domain-containing protein n=1 Tax=[Ruminococcus] torques TaxID=33039 RepID=UPI00242C13CD|nr:beta-N-acetylglucosaminidase domain-containing protein [[Ruminococcus] torques]
MAGRVIKRLLAGVLTVAVVIPGNFVPAQAAEEPQEDYLIYPNPHKVEYQEGDYILGKELNVIYDKGIDEATKNRLQEAADLKGIEVNEAEQPKEGATNVYVGVHGQDGTAEDYITEEYQPEESLFGKTDSYFLASDENVISVLGKDADSAFYGLTTLYHVFAQMDGLTIRNFEIEDYADVVSRGFIEGYYGNPWSTQDRVNLMKWGGYYKLNAYFYAPKDDPKHRTQWDQLYTEEELANKIRPLAEAGNESKCRFVYALHPFPQGNHLRFDDNYEADLAKLQAKFKQVIDQGVRQIAILADDFWNPGGPNGVRLLNDMTAWLEEVKKQYPDMKMTIPYVPYDYMGNGSSAELQELKKAPANVQIVMTGGRVWGEVTNNFTSTFTNNVGRGPFMWINWPCTDNSKKHLIMGGYDTFLHPGVEPSKIQGIMLNPMQQSEPSKVAIFGNADYAWNIWETKEEADKSWNDAFSFVDHNSAITNDASDALRELSKHMINQAMDTRVTPLQESVVLKEKLNAFKEKLEAETLTAEEVDAVIAEFEVLQKASKTYRAGGNEAIKGQIVYWLNCWDDTTEAAIAYLNGVKSALAGDVSSVISYNTAGKTAFDRSKTYDFLYVDHQEYAEVGVQHIVPFINTLAEYVSAKVETAVNPDKVIPKFITSRKDAPTGSKENIFDGDESTSAVYKTPNSLSKDDYIGVEYNKVIDIDSIRFLLGGGKDHFEHAKLQYMTEEGTWEDLTLTGMENNFAGEFGKVQDINVKEANLPSDLKAKGIRLIATAANVNDCWLEVREIQINKKEEVSEDTERYTGDVTFSGISTQGNDHTAAKMFDGDLSTEMWIAKGPYSGEGKDTIAADAYIQITFPEAKQIGSIRMTQGKTSSADVFKKVEIQYSTDGQSGWKKAGEFTNAKDQTVNINVTDKIKAIRLVNKEQTAGWVRIGELDIRAPKNMATPITYKVIKTDRWTVVQNTSETSLYDGDDNTFVWYDPDGSGNSTGDDALKDDFLGYDLGTEAVLESAHIVVGNNDADKIVKYAVETSVDNSTWTPAEGYAEYTGVETGKDVLNIDLKGVTARYIRIRNLETREKWVKFSEFTVKQKIDQAGTAENVYTNVKNHGMLGTTEAGMSSLQPGTISLKKDQYIGVDLKNIKAIENIAVNAGENANVKLQSSMNGVIWTDVNAGALEDARYVRLYNAGNETQNVSVQEFKVTYAFIGEKTVESDFAQKDSANDMRSNGQVGNVFDGKLNTLGKITGTQDAGKKIVFDLGQTVNFESFRYYVKETCLDFLRHAKFEVADRKDATDDQWTKILEVGNAEAVQMSANATAKDADYLLHDTTNPGNMYAEATGLNVSGRYLRIVPLTTYTERWVELYELQINGGAYMTTESNRDIISETAEEAGKIPSNVFDGNFATTYKPSAANGSFTYRISEPDQRTIRIIQNGKASNADVQAVLYKDGAKQEAAAIGKLNQTINEFAVGKDSQILEVIVTWAEDIPEISIIKTSEKEKAAVNKDALNEAIKKPIDDKWTADSKQAAEEAKAAAEEIAANEYVTQEVVDLAEKALLAAHKNAVVKGDVTALENALNNMKAGKENVGTEEAPVYVEIYSARTYAAYESVMNEIREALKDKENVSEKEAQDLTAKLEKAEKALVYSSIQRELAETELENAVKYNKDDYTTVSYKAYTDAKSALDAIVKADKTERKNPKEVYTARNTFAQAEEGLVNIAALKAKLTEVEKLDEKLYMADSWNVLQDAVKNAEAYLENGTKDQVDKAVSDLENAVNGLVEKTEVTVDDVIAEMEKINGKDYTEVSFGALQDAISKAKADKDQNDPALDQANITAMKEAKAALVSIVDLKAALNEAAQHKAGTYTVSSYKLLKDAVTNAEPLKVNGTKEEVANAAAAIRAAIKGLDKRAVGLDEYRDSIVLKKPEGYTEESYAAYKNAYDALMALDSKETTAEMFANAKSAFEAAQAGLVQKPGSNGTGSSSNGTVSNGAVATGDTVNVSALAGLFLSLLMIAAFMKRKTFLGFFEKDE